MVSTTTKWICGAWVASFFEVLSLYPLFPGTNELDQVTKIHQILGTPPAETLAKLKKHSNSHIDFNFPTKEGQPMAKLIPHCTADCIDVIVRLLAYDPDDRISARQAVKHPYFKDLRAAELKDKQANPMQQEETEAPAAQQAVNTRKDKSTVPGPQDNSGGSGMLPSIDKKAKDKRLHSKELGAMGGGLSAAEAEAAPPADAGAPSQQATLPYVHTTGDAEESAAAGTLPPIGGFHGAGGQSGVSALKIDSKSLTGGQAKGKAGNLAKGNSRFHQSVISNTGIKKGSTSKAAATTQLSLQSRSCASCGDVLDFGVSNSGVGGSSSQHASSQHGSQPSIEAEVMSLGGKGLGKKTYQSPYSQRHAGKQKV